MLHSASRSSATAAYGYDHRQPGITRVSLIAAAKALGRAKQTILHWVHSGKLRSVQVRSGKRRGLRIELKRDETGLFADAR
jgi:hypothetical protein